MRYLIEHETVLEYPHTVREHHIELRLSPRPDGHQKVLSSVIETVPPSELSTYHDYFGNRVDYFCVIPPHRTLITRLRSEVETLKENPFSFTSVPPSEEQEWLSKELRAAPALYDFILHRSLLTPSVDKLAEVIEAAIPKRDQSRPMLESLLELQAWVSAQLEYRPGSTEVHGSLVASLRQGGGVCQEFAHLFITVVRAWDIPARYVMGYLDPGISGTLETTLSTHAWAEVLVPGGGWIGFDATHNLLANDHYVAVAIGRDSYDAAPQRGSFKGDSAGEQPEVTVTMQEQ